ncbi:MAG: tRNA (adenosine(37)-N6)-threonylcarbamoyltransferase complex ATPase subunit type 1 TsaE [Chloroflexi bacterium]|nr:tRNA (adenosine(37)-N6)-threonylcarbamoyltransferase complex ATPase subunit type 1 TsaE [Chloroflexota bacterium]
MKYLSKNEQDTAALAAEIAGKLKSGDLLCLQGDLGSGKTVFARALIRHLCADPALDVPSPTFTLVQTYESPAGELWHFDLYRLEDPEEIYELGWEDALADGIAIVEWPERLESLAPPDCLTLVFEPSDHENQREITAVPYGSWKDRL